MGKNINTSWLHSNAKKDIVKNTIKLNDINGSDAERYAASQGIIATGGEIRWGSRKEDNRKIDFLVSFEHPWVDKELCFILCQVKSGPKYGRLTKYGFALKEDTVRDIKRSSHSICVIWLDRKSKNIYWAYLHVNTEVKYQPYRSHHILTPAFKFDIARCLGNQQNYTKGGRGIIIQNLNTNLNFDVYRKKVNLLYKSLNKKITSPVLGEIEFTKLGWRHMMRKSRLSSHKTESLLLVPYLEFILKRIPNIHIVKSCKYRTVGDFQFRLTEHYLEFYEVKINGSPNNESRAVIKLLEEVKYPIDWYEKGIISQLVKRRVVLLGCFIK